MASIGTQEWWEDVQGFWNDAGIDIGDVPVQTPYKDPDVTTYPLGDPLPGGGWSPGASADPTPLTEDPFANKDEVDTDGGSAPGGSAGSMMGLLAGGSILLILFGGLK